MIPKVFDLYIYFCPWTFSLSLSLYLYLYFYYIIKRHSEKTLRNTFTKRHIPTAVQSATVHNHVSVEIEKASRYSFIVHICSFISPDSFTKHSIIQLRQLSYSPDIVSWNFWLFSKLKSLNQVRWMSRWNAMLTQLHIVADWTIIGSCCLGVSYQSLSLNTEYLFSTMERMFKDKDIHRSRTLLGQTSYIFKVNYKIYLFNWQHFIMKSCQCIKLFKFNITLYINYKWNY